MSLRLFVIASVAVVLLTSLCACGARPADTGENTSAETGVADIELVHPPYTDGAGTVSGELVSSTVSTYPAGSTQSPIPFPAIIVSWSSDGAAGVSEFLVNGSADLVLDGELERQATAERISAVLESTSAGTAVMVDYGGSDLVPTWYATPPSDFPYALVATLTIGPRDLGGASN